MAEYIIQEETLTKLADAFRKHFELESCLVRYIKNYSSDEIYIPEGVVRIGRAVYYGNTYIKTLKIPDSVKYIDDNAFCNCRNLASVSLPNGLIRIGEDDDFVTIPDCIFSSNGGVFSSSAIESVYLPDSVCEILYKAFSYCTNLRNINIPKSITKIGNQAFSYCTNLTSVDFEGAPKIIGNMAFSNCTNLALTSLPEGIITISGNAFSDCTNLALTSLPKGVTTIDGYAFSNCTNLALTSLPEGVTSIGRYAFNNCPNLALTSLPESITAINDYAFSNCTNLVSITFKGTPTRLSSGAFENCVNLTTINVPWAEGTLWGAPWGATNATINYNYVEG